MVLLFNTKMHAQVGINNVDPKASLDITASSTTSPISTDGILIPRVDEYPASPGANQDGMMVYLTGNGAPVEGFYFWNGSSWLNIDGGKDWGKSGNTGTNTTSNFIGTQDNVGFRFRTNNTNQFELTNTGLLRAFQNGTAAAPLISWNSDNNMGIYRLGTDALGFSTAGSERIRIDANGNIGFSTGANALSKLEISEASSTQGPLYSHITNTGSNFSAVEGYNANVSGGAGMLAVGYYGVYGIGTLGIAGDGSTGLSGYGFTGVEGIPVDVVADWAGYFFGDIGINNDSYATNYWIWSDERIKSNIEPVNNALSIIDQLNPVTYNKKFVVERKPDGSISGNSKSKRSQSIPTQFESSTESEIGLLAQEVKSVLPQLVKEKNMNLSILDSDKLMSVNYIGIIPVLIKAVQEQQTEIELLKMEIEAMKRN